MASSDSLNSHASNYLHYASQLVILIIVFLFSFYAALQARSGYSNNRECLSPDGFALNSKWDEAEKYICNPLSGEIPMECLSAKTLSGRSFRSLTNRVTMSAPLVFSNHSRQIHTRTTAIATHDDIANHFPIKGYNLNTGCCFFLKNLKKRGRVFELV